MVVSTRPGLSTEPSRNHVALMPACSEGLSTLQPKHSEPLDDTAQVTRLRGKRADCKMSEPQKENAGSSRSPGWPRRASLIRDRLKRSARQELQEKVRILTGLEVKRWADLRLLSGPVVPLASSDARHSSCRDASPHPHPRSGRPRGLL